MCCGCSVYSHCLRSTYADLGAFIDNHLAYESFVSNLVLFTGFRCCNSAFFEFVAAWVRALLACEWLSNLLLLRDRRDLLARLLKWCLIKLIYYILLGKVNFLLYFLIINQARVERSYQHRPWASGYSWCIHFSSHDSCCLCQDGRTND